LQPKKKNRPPSLVVPCEKKAHKVIFSNRLRYTK